MHLVDHTLPLARKPAQLVYLITVGGIAGWLVGSRWREKLLLLRRALVITAGPRLVSSLFFGYVDECRAFYKAIPVAVLLSVLTVARLLGGAESSAATSR